ncbi:MAG TPA: cysteine desulfurase, partial [Dermatophilaceae bacterium]
PSGAVRASVGVGTELEAVERLISAVQAYVTTGLSAHYVVVDGCWAIADDPRPLIQVHGLFGLAAQAAACTSTAE